MKLRNETRFRINELKTDFDQMRVRVQLSLHDLHLVGSYERATTEDNDPSIMYYAPSYGQVELVSSSQMIPPSSSSICHFGPRSCNDFTTSHGFRHPPWGLSGTHIIPLQL